MEREKKMGRGERREGLEFLIDVGRRVTTE